MQKTAKNLERIPDLTGTVVHGNAIGRTIGFPTANLATDQPLEAWQGVYISRVRLGDQNYYGITNIGRRPTVDDDQQMTLETHILDFDGDIYGATMTVRLLKKIRPITKFDSLEGLVRQLEKDRQCCRDYMEKDCV